MSPKESDNEGFFARRVSLKWVIVTVVVLVVIMAAIVVTVLLVDRSRDNTRREAAIAATSTTGVTSPYDLTELPIETDLDRVKDAAFLSILVPNEGGTLTSYGISSDLPAAQALTQAIKDADSEDTGTPASGTTTQGDTSVPSTGSTITFVLPTRETLTFVLDLDQGLIYRGDQTFRPEGDLRALVEAAIAGP